MSECRFWLIRAADQSDILMLKCVMHLKPLCCILIITTLVMCVIVSLMVMLVQWHLSWTIMNPAQNKSRHAGSDSLHAAICKFKCLQSNACQRASLEGARKYTKTCKFVHFTLSEAETSPRSYHLTAASCKQPIMNPCQSLLFTRIVY